MLNQPFFQITLPLMVTFIATIWTAQWSQNKRFDDLKEKMNEKFNEISKRLDKIEEKISNLEQIRWR